MSRGTVLARQFIFQEIEMTYDPIVEAIRILARRGRGNRQS